MLLLRVLVFNFVGLIRGEQFGFGNLKFFNESCSEDSLEQSGQCVDKCDADFVQCWLACDGDQQCTRKCASLEEDCLNKCPCHLLCPNGCPCDEFECQQCEDLHDEEMHKCNEDCLRHTATCIYTCPLFDSECADECVKDNYDCCITACPCGPVLDPDSWSQLCGHPDVNACLNVTCGELEICVNTPDSFECVNQEEIFEDDDPNRIVLASTYSMDPASPKLDLPQLQKEYNILIDLAPFETGRGGRKSTEDIFRLTAGGEVLLDLKYLNMEEDPVLQIAIADMKTVTVSASEKQSQVQILQMKSKGKYFLTVNANGVELVNEKVEPKRIQNAVFSILSFGYVPSAEVINANEVSNHVCGSGSSLENMWVVDGTGSYSSYVSTAEMEFKKNRDYLKSREIDAKLGVAFFADRDHDFSVALEELYVLAMPLTNVYDITDSMIAEAFKLINGMGGGHDSPEDILLAMDFTMDSNIVQWDPAARVKLLSIFTDVPFHYKGDSKDTGIVDAPLVAWWQPEPTYHYHDPAEISVLADQLSGDIPFSLDFYLTGSSGIDAEYEKYFVAGKQEEGWFMLRKQFRSDNIEESFKEKMANMEEVLKRADEINGVFADKCEDKNSPDVDEDCLALPGRCVYGEDECNGVIVPNECSGQRQCCTGECTLMFFESEFISDLSGNKIRIANEFIPIIQTMNGALKECSVTMLVTHSFRAAEKDSAGNVLGPNDHSAHLVGCAVDFVLVTSSGVCDYDCMMGRGNSQSNCFADIVKAKNLDIKVDKEFVNPRPMQISYEISDNAKWMDLFNRNQKYCTL